MNLFQHNLMHKNLLGNLQKVFAILILIIGVNCFAAKPILAQELDPQPLDDPLKSLRSDVGIVGLSANLDWWNTFTYLGSDSLKFGTNHEVEIVFRDVRMLSSRLGVGFMLLGSFFVDGSDFGVGGWGLGPVIRAYPLQTDRFMPYFQAQALLGNNLGLGELADTINEANGFRMRLGLRAGLGIRVTNNFGFFIEFGPAWESSTFFKADSRVWQLNVGIDLYRFKR